MANAVTTFEAALATTSLSLGQQAEVKTHSDQMARDLWIHFCDHEVRHLDAIAEASPLDAEIQARVADLKQVVAQMKLNGMPDVALLEVV